MEIFLKMRMYELIANEQYSKEASFKLFIKNRSVNMKFGPRKPSLKRSIKARTTGRAKRKIKKAVIPGYGKKGMGYIKNPKKAVYNKVYNKTTFKVFPSILGSTKSTKKNKNSESSKGHPIKQEKVAYNINEVNHLINDGQFSIYELTEEKLNELKRNREEYKIKKQQEKARLPFWRKLFYSDKPQLNNQQKSIYKEAMFYFGQEVGEAGERMTSAKNPGEIFEAYFASIEALYNFIKLYENSGNIINYEGKPPFEILENLVSSRDELFTTAIKEYYESEKESAMELKTTRGQNNRMKRKYEDLMEYEYVFTENEKKLIIDLWDEYLDLKKRIHISKLVISLSNIHINS